MKTLCVIPARSGSKRLPDKAILPFAGANLIKITCQQATRIKEFDSICFSSDSGDYCVESAKCGITNWHQRPPDLATDDARVEDVLRDVILRVEEVAQMEFDAVVLLQVTSPLRSDDEIKFMIELLDDRGFEHVRSVCWRDHVLPTEEYHSESRPQLNGAIYGWHRDVLFLSEDRDIRQAWLNMPQERSIDIDTEFDFKVAEFIYENKLHEV